MTYYVVQDLATTKYHAKHGGWTKKLKLAERYTSFYEAKGNMLAPMIPTEVIIKRPSGRMYTKEAVR